MFQYLDTNRSVLNVQNKEGFVWSHLSIAVQIIFILPPNYMVYSKMLIFAK